MTQLGTAATGEGTDVETSAGRGLSETGTIVNLSLDIEMAPP